MRSLNVRNVKDLYSLVHKVQSLAGLSALYCYFTRLEQFLSTLKCKSMLSSLIFVVQSGLLFDCIFFDVLNNCGVESTGFRIYWGTSGSLSDRALED